MMTLWHLKQVPSQIKIMSALCSDANRLGDRQSSTFTGEITDRLKLSTSSSHAWSGSGAIQPLGRRYQVEASFDSAMATDVHEGSRDLGG